MALAKAGKLVEDHVEDDGRQTRTATGKWQLGRVSLEEATPDKVFDMVDQDGGVVIQGFLSPDQVRRFNQDIDPELASLKPGSTHSDPFTVDFHGHNTKRLTNLVTRSKTFREEILDCDLVHRIADRFFRESSGTYWMNTAEVIEIGPQSRPQPLHRDLESNVAFVALGPAGPEIQINFLIALSPFSAENGATRVIPGSHRWSDFHRAGDGRDTVPATMNTGDALFLSGKTVHGGGANSTSTERRRAVALTFQPGYLTPEEAYPFMVDLALVKHMSRRAQQMIGFRSQYPKGAAGLWQIDCKELGDVLGL